jgi:hypothetical protein
LFFIDGELVADVQIRRGSIRLGETLACKLRVDCLFYLRIHDLVWVLTSLDGDPLVSVKLGEIRSGHMIGLRFLSG